ncbi:MAG: Gfo/Idh/MocA family oxidoreductase [Acholeplasmatales bacterium]|nr:Gfo/Idh/MocA family oxidoreductase [Acholeplasmatales bacterium]
MNFGIIGLGNIANKFAKTLNEMNETLYAVASRNIDKAKEFGQKYNSVKCYGSYDELFSDPNIDVVYISTPNNMHFQNAYDALSHNKNVICEKPFTTNPFDAIKLYSYAKEKNLFIMEALWIEFLPAYKKIIEIIKSGKIGDLIDLSVSYGFDTNPDRKKRKFDSKLAGGALLDIGIYNLGFIDMIVDDEVSSFTSDYKLNDAGTDEYSKINLLFKNNIKATLVTTIGTDIKREAFINGTKGSIYIPDFQQNQEFIVKTDKEEKYSYPFDINGFEYQIREIIDSINNNRCESINYPSYKSIRLMKLLYDIRMSWNMKFSFE